MDDTPTTTEPEIETPVAEEEPTPRRRRARAASEDTPPPSPAKTQKYVVRKTSIAPFGGGRDALLPPGTVVELDGPTAKHYNALGFLAPHIED
jgi:hypothetical protein